MEDQLHQIGFNVCTRETGRLRPAHLHHVLAKADQQERPMIYNAPGRAEGRCTRIGWPKAWW
jgi:hypothetical protein